MSPEARPAAISFQPGSGALPPALEPAIIDSDSPILLLVAADTGDEVARAAIALTEARAATGKPTILADASLRGPRLHQPLDADNMEGLADVFLFGASLDHVRTRPATRSFDFVPTGPYVPDPSAVLESSRWPGIARTLRSEGTRLFVFVPADSPGLGILSRRAGEAVLLGDARSIERAASRLDPACEVLAVVAPAPAMAPDRLSEEAGAAADPGATTIFDQPELTEPVVFRGDRKGRRAVSPVLLLLLLAALLAAGWFAYEEYLAVDDTAIPTQPAPETSAEPVRGEPAETPIPISVQVEAHQDLESAMERVADLDRAEPEIGFYVAPVTVRGTLYYRLLAGPVADSAAGERLMDRLVERGHKTAADPWAILPTQLAFHLGEFDTEAEARARVRELAEWAVEAASEDGGTVERPAPIPAYVVPIRHDPGEPRYRVYGGAYGSRAEAEAMRELLAEAGVEARLVPRTGAPVEEGS